MLSLAALVSSGHAADWGKAVPESHDAALLERGLQEAEEFRRELCQGGLGPLADLIARFQKESAKPLQGRYDLRRFPPGTNWIAQAICQGQGPVDEDLFDAFAGKWFGLWESMPVDHDWHPTVRYAKPNRVEGPNPVRVRAAQYAWIGDGFGWNLLASPAGATNQTFVLGTVYHVVEGDPRRIRLHRPHVGIYAGGGRLVWITRGEVFFEEIQSAGPGQSARYSITGFHYQRDQDQPRWRGAAFQAVYTRDARERPEFYKFNLD